MNPNFYQVRQDWGSSGWRLYFGDDKSCVQIDGEINGRVFPTVALAKAVCWRRFHEVPVRVQGTEGVYDPMQPLHAALGRLESRHGATHAIVAVGSAHYLVRHSKFRAESVVHYTVSDDAKVVARHDSEPIGTSFTETVQHPTQPTVQP